MALAPNAVSAVSAPARPSWNPLKFTGTDLPTELLIMVKTLALVVLVVNHVRILPDPWLPFVPGIDDLPPVLFQRTLQVVFVTSALALLFNRRVRLASLILGATMLLAVVSSKAYYGNNKTFCGLMFFLTGLYSPGGSAWPVRWQLGITYFGAGLNKLLDPDWHTGVFFENWAVHRLHQPWYIALDSILPPLWMGRFMCWLTIVAELGQISRFAKPTQLMAYSGLVPSEFSSGPRTVRGRITKSGNAHLRRVIVEAAWAYQFRPWCGGYLLKRQAGLSEEIKEIGWKAQIDCIFVTENSSREEKTSHRLSPPLEESCWDLSGPLVAR